MERVMLEDDVRKAFEEIQLSGKKPSVRLLRDAVGRGSFTDIGEILRKINEERDRENMAHRDLPPSLQAKCSVYALDLWLESQELANSAVEDIRRGCELRVTQASKQVDELLRDADKTEAVISELTEKLNERDAALLKLTKSNQETVGRLASAELELKSLDAQLLAIKDHARQRDEELQLAYGSVNSMLAVLGSQARAKGVDRDQALNKSANQAEADHTSNDQAEKQTVEPGEMVREIIGVMKKANKPLTCAEVHARLPRKDSITLRQLYNLLYRSAAAGSTFASTGHGKYILREEPDVSADKKV
jgi:hypothetical protein